MEKITHKINALDPASTYFSLEFFPPKTQIGFSNLQTRLERMSSTLRPLFVTVTWGAGGSTSSRSLELAEICQRQLGITTCLHLTCTNMKRRVVDEALVEAKVAIHPGKKNIDLRMKMVQNRRIVMRISHGLSIWSGISGENMGTTSVLALQDILKAMRISHILPIKVLCMTYRIWLRRQRRVQTL